ncbi:MAG: hypothetical protein WDZ94_01035 [Patescibacteria group bacterium]
MLLIKTFLVLFTVFFLSLMALSSDQNIVSAQTCSGGVTCWEQMTDSICSNSGNSCSGSSDCPGGECESGTPIRKQVDSLPCNFRGASCGVACNPGLETRGSCGQPQYPQPPPVQVLEPPPDPEFEPDEEATYGCWNGQCIAMDGGSYTSNNCADSCVPDAWGCFNNQCVVMPGGQGCQGCIEYTPPPWTRERCSDDTFATSVDVTMVKPGDTLDWYTYATPPSGDPLSTAMSVDAEGDAQVMPAPISPYRCPGNMLCFIVSASGKPSVDSGTTIWAMRVFNKTTKQYYFADFNGETLSMTAQEFDRAEKNVSLIHDRKRCHGGENTEQDCYDDGDCPDGECGSGKILHNSDAKLPWYSCASLINLSKFTSGNIANRGWIMDSYHEGNWMWKKCDDRQLHNDDFWSGNYWGMESHPEVRAAREEVCADGRECGRRPSDNRYKYEADAPIKGGTYYRQAIIKIPTSELMIGQNHFFEIDAAGAYFIDNKLDWCGNKPADYYYPGPAEVDKYAASCPLFETRAVDESGEEGELGEVRTQFNQQDKVEVRFIAERNYEYMRIFNGNFDQGSQFSTPGWEVNTQNVNAGIFDCETQNGPCPTEASVQRLQVNRTSMIGDPWVRSQWTETQRDSTTRDFIVEFYARALASDGETTRVENIGVLRRPYLVAATGDSPSYHFGTDSTYVNVDFSDHEHGGENYIELNDTWRHFRGTVSFPESNNDSTQMQIYLRPANEQGRIVEFDELALATDPLPDKVQIFRANKQTDPSVYCATGGETPTAGWVDLATWEKSNSEASPIEHLGYGTFKYTWETDDLDPGEYVLISHITPGSNKVGEEFDTITGTSLTCTGNPGQCYEDDPVYSNCSSGSDGAPFTAPACNTFITLNECNNSEPWAPRYVWENNPDDYMENLVPGSFTDTWEILPSDGIPLDDEDDDEEDKWNSVPDSGYNRNYQGLALKHLPGAPEDRVDVVEMFVFDPDTFEDEFDPGDDIPTLQENSIQYYNYVSDDDLHPISLLRGSRHLDESNELILATRAVNRSCEDSTTYSPWNYARVRLIDEIELNFREATTDQCTLEDSNPLEVEGDVSLSGTNFSETYDRDETIGNPSNRVDQYRLRDIPISKDSRDFGGQYDSLAFTLDSVAGEREMQACGIAADNLTTIDSSSITIDSPSAPSRHYLLFEEREYEAWWQARNGLIFAVGHINTQLPLRAPGGSPVPSTACGDNPGVCTPYLIARHPWNSTAERIAGVPISNHDTITLGEGVGGWYTNRADDPEQRATDDPVPQQAVVADFYGTVMSEIDTGREIIELPGTQSDPVRADEINAAISNSANRYDTDGHELYVIELNSTHLTLNEIITIDANQQVLILAPGDLTLSRESTERIVVSNGGFLGVFTDGHLTFGDSIGHTDPTLSTPIVAGVYVSDKELRISSGGQKFVGEGSFVGLGGISLGRGFSDQSANSYSPSEIFIHRPDLVINTPDLLKESETSWREVN